MKLRSAIIWCYRLFPGWKRMQWLKMLRRQRSLLHQGVESEAEILQIFLFEERFGKLMPVRFWIKLRITDQSYIYTYSFTFIKCSAVLRKGNRVKLRYNPADLSVVMIMDEIPKEQHASIENLHALM